VQRGRPGAGLLALVLLLTSLGGIAVGLWYPDPADGERYSYEQIQAIHDAWWGWHVFAGVNLVLGVGASALAGWLLVRSRGAALAIVGGTTMCVGAALYGVGLGVLAGIFGFGADPDAIDTVNGTKLLDYAQDRFAMLYGPLLAGAVLVALGTILLAVALWRASTAPRWVPLTLATVPITFIAANGVAGALALLPLSAGTVALGWYAWRPRTAPAAGDDRRRSRGRRRRMRDESEGDLARGVSATIGPAPTQPQAPTDDARAGVVATRWRRWAAWAALGLIAALVALTAALWPWDVGVPFVLLTVVSFGGVGGFLAIRRPLNPIGWLLLGFGTAAAIRVSLEQYAYHAIVTDPGSLPGADWAASIAVHVWHPAFVLLALTLLLFPNGRPLSDRWRRVAIAAVVLGIVGLVSGMLESDFVAEQLSYVEEPLITGPVSEVAAIVFTVFLLAANIPLLLLAATSFVLRLRRARGDERLQLRWFGLAVVIVVLSLPLSLLAVGDGTVFALLLPLIPIAAAVTILKYRLYDIEIVVRRSLVYAALTAFVLGIYAAVVGLSEIVVSDRLGIAASIVAAAIVAVALIPLRERVQRGVDRLLYGERRDPYLVLSRLAGRLEQSLAPEDVLPSVVETVAHALKLPYAAVELGGETGSRVAAAYGSPSSHSERLPLVYRGDVVGELVLGVRPGESEFSAADRRLLEDLARQAGIAAHAVALTQALQRSRERLVAAREEERRRLRRDLHDGLGPALAAIILGVGAAENLVRPDPDAAETALQDLRRQTQSAIDDIRRLVYELRPPSLDELGLLGALREQAARLNGSLQVVVDAPDDLPPLPAAVEVAAYRIALEAFTNAARHAATTRCAVRITANGELELFVTDDGKGISPNFRPGVGIASMRERAAELGGTCTVERSGSRGTTVHARLPLSLR
jgi:signal transduction histidine kinase